MAKRAVLITGASTGIGEACAVRLAGDGWKVYAGVRKTEDGDRLVDEISGDVEPLMIDVCTQESIDGAIDTIRSSGLYGLVNNAGISAGGAVESTSMGDWREVFDTNLFGLVAMTRAAFPLVQASGGRFVHIGSIAGRVASPGLGPYAATKHAVAAFNWSLRAELARVGGATSSVVEPGEIKTEIWSKAEARIETATAELEEQGLKERYQWLLDMFRGFLAEADEKAIGPDKVADAVEHALTSKRPKARYLVGTDARIQAKIALLPDRARELAMRKGADGLIKNGVALRSGGE